MVDTTFDVPVAIVGGLAYFIFLFHADFIGCCRSGLSNYQRIGKSSQVNDSNVTYVTRTGNMYQIISTICLAIIYVCEFLIVWRQLGQDPWFDENFRWTFSIAISVSLFMIEYNNIEKALHEQTPNLVQLILSHARHSIVFGIHLTLWNVLAIQNKSDVRVQACGGVSIIFTTIGEFFMDSTLPSLRVSQERGIAFILHYIGKVMRLVGLGLFLVVLITDVDDDLLLIICK